MNIGVISDTHGLLREEAVEALRGCELILHLGDVGRIEVLERLGEVAPVKAIRGNVDVEGRVARLPERLVVEVEGKRLLLIHNVKELRKGEAEGMDAVLFGHTHKAMVEEREGVLWFNPGSAGPRRFRLPVTVGRLDVSEGRSRAVVVELL